MAGWSNGGASSRALGSEHRCPHSRREVRRRMPLATLTYRATHTAKSTAKGLYSAKVDRLPLPDSHNSVIDIPHDHGIGSAHAARTPLRSPPFRVTLRWRTYTIVEGQGMRDDRLIADGFDRVGQVRQKCPDAPLPSAHGHHLHDRRSYGERTCTVPVLRMHGTPPSSPISPNSTLPPRFPVWLPSNRARSNHCTGYVTPLASVTRNCSESG